MSVLWFDGLLTQVEGLGRLIEDLRRALLDKEADLACKDER